MHLSKESLAKLATVYAGLVFGIYWIPLRALAEAGFAGVWSTVLFNLVPLVLLAPLFAYRWRRLIPGRLRLHVGGFCTGMAFVLYATAFLYTEIVRAIVLFYLMPVWGFLLARIFAGDAITAARWGAIALGIGGLALILGGDAGLPVPRNAGDWMALGSGLTWATASLLLLTDREGNPVDYSLLFFFWGTVGAGAAAWIASMHGLALPDGSKLGQVLPWLVPIAVLIVIPAGFATIYGPTQLNPGVVGLLFMSEVSVATITAALWAGEPFGLRTLLAVVLISLAGLAEPLRDLLRSRHPAAAVGGRRGA